MDNQEEGRQPSETREKSGSLEGAIAGQHFQGGAFDSIEMEEYSEDDPYDAFLAEEYDRERGWNDPHSDAHVEFAGDLSPAPPLYSGFATARGDNRFNRSEDISAAVTPDDTQEAERSAQSKTFGWIAIILAVASMFYWPGVLGTAAVVVGIIAFIRGNKVLGAWAVALGLLSLIALLYLVPNYT